MIIACVRCGRKFLFRDDLLRIPGVTPLCPGCRESRRPLTGWVQAPLPPKPKDEERICPMCKGLGKLPTEEKEKADD